MIDDAKKFFLQKVVPFTSTVSQLAGPQVCTYLLAGIFLQLRELQASVEFGASKFDIKPITFSTDAQKILERETTGRVRKVEIWIDSPVGIATPTIRVSKSATSHTSGGIKLNAGAMNVIGEIPPDVELYGVSSASIQGYLIERA